VESEEYDLNNPREVLRLIENGNNQIAALRDIRERLTEFVRTSFPLQ